MRKSGRIPVQMSGAMSRITSVPGRTKDVTPIRIKKARTIPLNKKKICVNFTLSALFVETFFTETIKDSNYCVKVVRALRSAA
jgi:hypothetical protein